MLGQVSQMIDATHVTPSFQGSYSSQLPPTFGQQFCEILDQLAVRVNMLVWQSERHTVGSRSVIADFHLTMVTTCRGWCFV